MESPLDILSRAAGMVSRNHEVSNRADGGGRADESISPHRENNSSSSSSSGSSPCRILKLALVSSNGHNNKSQSPKQGYEYSLNMTPPPESRESPEVMINNNGIDSDTPLDMSIKKPKRRLDKDSDSSEDNQSGGSGSGGGGGMDEDRIKRKRPSVISYASHPSNNMNEAGLDVDDHFKKSLGIESYNSVFSGNAKITSTMSAEVPEKPERSTHEDSKRKTNNSNSSSKVILQSSDLENSVDDHFAKALGKSTWLKLQGL